MRSGEFRDVVVLERIAGTGDGSWQPFDGPARMSAQVLGRADGNYTVTIRYRPDFCSKRQISRGVRLRQVLADGTELVMDVLDVVEGERRKTSQLTCRDRLVETERITTGAHGVKGEGA